MMLISKKRVKKVDRNQQRECLLMLGKESLINQIPKREIPLYKVQKKV